MRLKKVLLVFLGLALLIPSLVFGAAVNVNLKDSVGADFTDLSNVTVRILDGVGSLVSETTAPTTAQVSVNNLSSLESYTIIVKYNKTQAVDQNGDVIIDTASTKSLRFADDTETISKDFFIQNPVASNVLMRVTGIPTDHTGVRIHLTPVESSRSQIDKTELLFTAIPVNGTVDLTVPAIPAIGYTWTIGNQDDSVSMSGDNTKRARTNGTFTFALNPLKTPTITALFHLKNIDRTDATWAGESIHIDIKDANNAIIYTKDIIANGAEASDTTPSLAQGSYTIIATYSNGGVIKREATRTANLYSTARTSIINFTKLDTVNIDFLVRDSRTSANLNAGSIKIMDSSGTLIEELPLNGSVITKPLVFGYPYTLEVSATGYSARTTTLYPRADSVKEISLFKL